MDQEEEEEAMDQGDEEEAREEEEVRELVQEARGKKMIKGKDGKVRITFFHFYDNFFLNPKKQNNIHPNLFLIISIIPEKEERLNNSKWEVQSIVCIGSEEWSLHHQTSESESEKSNVSSETYSPKSNHLWENC